MRSLFILVFILCLENVVAQNSYSYKATYQLEYQEDSTDENSILSETVVLYLGEGISRYSSLGKAVKDSLGAFEAPETDFNYKIYKNYQDNEITLAESITADRYKYKYEQDLNTIDWEIEPENKEILGFSVQKAVGSFAGRSYIAWFAPELPFSDGPYKFNGLPGLILEISDIKDDYHFRLTAFQEFEKPVTKKSNLDNYKLVSQEELDQFRDDNDRDPIAAMRNAGLKIAFSKKEHEIETRKMLSEKYERRNNPIELQPK
ncbi:GLPGLI family protein [Zunongwangia sp. HRR-M8]|uniref:GLPGLI family protein n=1 Tax=Zunongwangia sp. HRR-M8 TaxID=3015170 RepID=UPI0022DDD0CD|nr:GLPGLI family protein [Zunongwangia sp. HRR-M8]WBL22876.1 GLPGLI family protein [Zunongwangia sp. HRR-M8]